MDSEARSTCAGRWVEGAGWLSASVVCVVGPTASGKTELAQAIAQNIKGEVVSADSMQVYRGMDIGTGKILPEDRLVPHHGIDLVDPGEPFSAAVFQEYARSCFLDIDGRSKRSILCGGTGFYVRAAIDDYEFPQGTQVENTVREYYNRIAQDQGAQALWALLDKRDGESAKLIAPGDVRRVVRAFELLDEGTSYAIQRSKLAVLPQCVPACFVGLAVDPALLRARIDARVDRMIEAGLVDEVKGLLNNGFRDGITAPQAIGYKEVVAALDGLMSFDEAIERIKVATHRYAKRQRTWFRKDARIHWICADSCNTDVLLEEALSVLANA